MQNAVSLTKFDFSEEQNRNWLKLFTPWGVWSSWQLSCDYEHQIAMQQVGMLHVKNPCRAKQVDKGYGKLGVLQTYQILQF